MAIAGHAAINYALRVRTLRTGLTGIGAAMRSCLGALWIASEPNVATIIKASK